MDGGVEEKVDSAVPKLIQLLEMFGYDTTPQQVVEVFEDEGLEIVSSEDYEDFVHGN